MKSTSEQGSPTASTTPATRRKGDRRRSSPEVPQQIPADTETWGLTDLPPGRSGRSGNWLRYALATLLFGGVVLSPEFASADIACYGEVKGLRAQVAGLLVGLPAGIGLTTLILLAASFMLPMAKLPSIKEAAAKVATYGGFGAIYGTILGSIAAASEMTPSGRQPTCEVSLLQTISDTATWGTLGGFMIAFPLMFRALRRASGSGRTSSDRTAATAMLTIVCVVGANWTVVITAMLAFSKAQP